MSEPTRRSLRADADPSEFAALIADSPRPSKRREKRPLLRSFRFWIPVSLLLLLIAAGIGTWIVGNAVAERAFAARDSLQQAIPLATQAKDEILAGDTVAAQDTVAALTASTARAREQASGAEWAIAEAVPLIGANLSAVRVVASTVDDLVLNALAPAAQLSIDDLAPVDGRVNTAALSDAAVLVDRAAAAVAGARDALNAIDRTDLIEQVSTGVAQLDDAVAQIEPIIEPAQTALRILPGILGADGPRNYLVLVQNNAESRGTGGNPASIVMLHVEDGAISITQQASSRDFPRGLAQPITELDPQSVALYGDKIGRYMMDVTTTPDFTESARIMGAFWAETFGTPVDGTLSIDPVALSYLLSATGPVTLQNGDSLTSDNAVSSLLSDVYFRYNTGRSGTDNQLHDAHFAMAASAVFDAVTRVQDPRAFIEQVARAVGEGRIMYVPTSEAEAEVIAGSRFSGRLPLDNAEVTMVGAYVNDTTEGKLDYYLDTAVTVGSDMCTVAPDATPAFTVDTTLTSTLNPVDVADLPIYVSSGRFFPKGVTSTDLVVYGPVGASFASASVDGAAVSATPIEHLGRTAVKINVLSDPASTHTVSVTYTGVAGATYGPIEAWHTPMVRDTPVTINAEGCEG